jgi:NAD(P)-dependent dehydrogenase (short-subunit alcohol dehydrogenase family)
MNTPIRDWRAQRVWIIGASSGIGAALAVALLERGASVAVSARRTEALRAVVAGHGAARVLPFDLTDRAALAAPATSCSGTGAASTWWCSAPAPMRRCAPGSSTPMTSTGCSTSTCARRWRPRRG